MEKTTRRLTAAEAAAYKNKTPLAVGYKIFNWDWTGNGEYCYTDADGIKALKQEGMVNFIDVRSAMWHGLLGV